ncbi:MAG: ATP-binding protein [Acidobacteriota bacterium]|nr:ATP-binding protein [Acidobacteriota bacterium]
MSETLALKVHTDRGEIGHITAEIETLAEREGWTPDLTFRVNLALEELVINIMDYGFDGGDHEIDITLVSEDHRLTIEIADSGKAFDPLTDAPVPDVDAPMDERPVGGLGVYLVRNMMDDMQYRRENDRNFLTLIANREQ